MALSRTLAAAAMGSALVVAGCGGSESGGGDDFFTTVGKSYAEASSEALALIDEANDVTTNNPILTPPGGTATYRGAVEFDYEVTSMGDLELAVADLRLNVDFDGPSGVTGNINNVVAETGTRYTGNLPITDGILTGGNGMDEVEYDADFSGTLIGGGNTLQITDGGIDGVFGGANGSHVSGFLDATTSYNSVAGTLTGDYGAMRQ